MDLLKIVAIAIIAVISIVLLRPTKPEMALIVGIGASIIIVLSVMDELFEVVYSFYTIAETTQIPEIGTPFKISIFSELRPPIAFTGMGTVLQISSSVLTGVSTVLTFVVVG